MSPQRRPARHLVALCAGLWALTAVALADPDARVQALLDVHRQALVGAELVRQCQRLAPAQHAALQQTWREWHARQELDEIARRAQRLAPQQAVGLDEAQRQRVHARLARAGEPARVCQELTLGWRGPGTDLRARYPLAYDPSLAGDGQRVFAGQTPALSPPQSRP